jgi:hypothetical protein
MSVLILEVTPLELTASLPKMLLYLTAFFGLAIFLSYGLCLLFGLRQPAFPVSLICGVILGSLVLFLSSFGMRYLFALSSVWRTTTVLYRERGNPRRMIAQQMMDVGALGYRRRIARTVELSSFLNYSIPLTEAELEQISKSAAWVEVNEEPNPFEWKGG